jgi:hypothetical protein
MPPSLSDLINQNVNVADDISLVKALADEYANFCCKVEMRDGSDFFPFALADSKGARCRLGKVRCTGWVKSTVGRNAAMVVHIPLSEVEASMLQRMESAAQRYCMVQGERKGPKTRKFTPRKFNGSVYEKHGKLFMRAFAWLGGIYATQISLPAKELSGSGTQFVKDAINRQQVWTMSDAAFTYMAVARGSRTVRPLIAITSLTLE